MWGGGSVLTTDRPTQANPKHCVVLPPFPWNPQPPHMFDTHGGGMMFHRLKVDAQGRNDAVLAAFVCFSHRLTLRLRGGRLFGTAQD